MSHEVSLQELLHELAETRALDFRGYKIGSLERRLRKRLAQLNLTDYRQYIEYFHAHPDEIDQLLQVVLINVTGFFRDPPAWEALRRQGFPLAFRGLRPGDSLRAWCAGCASGEEVYSLAILLAEHFGDGLKEYEVRIYATDHDEEALKVARRAEYPEERLAAVPGELRRRYFTASGSTLRVNREIRRMAIFGCSNLVNDAPISHVRLLLCRNVLIYFDVRLQREVLRRFHYALEPSGILFLGRSESQLRENPGFAPVSFTWRIFKAVPRQLQSSRPEVIQMDKATKDQPTLTTVFRSLLETTRSAVIVLGNDGSIVHSNEAAQGIWGLDGITEHTRLEETELPNRCPELLSQVERSRTATNTDTLRLTCSIRSGEGESSVEVTIRPILNPQGNRVGTLVYGEDVSHQQKLRSTIQELESTAEELHSANQELETTNEELQSTNEELETTNEELQSTNEELETTNEELHSLNEELETTNDELEARTRDMEELAARYSETLAMMPAPVVLTNEAGEVTLFNPSAERLFGLHSKGVAGLHISQLPIEGGLRSALLRRHKQIMSRQKPAVVRGVKVESAVFKGSLDVHFLPISIAGGRGVIITFDPYGLGVAPRAKTSVLKRKAAPRPQKSRQAAPRRTNSARPGRRRRS